MRATTLADRSRRPIACWWIVYDLCYCLDAYPDGIAALGSDWRSRGGDPIVGKAVQILRDKFETVNHYGPQELAIFHNLVEDGERAIYARRAYELVHALLKLL